MLGYYLFLFLRSMRSFAAKFFLSMSVSIHAFCWVDKQSNWALSLQPENVFLVSRKIDNQGSIQSSNGVVGLAAGQDVLLKASGAQRTFIRSTGAQGCLVL